MTSTRIEWIGELKEKTEAPEPSAIEKTAQRRSMMQWLHEKSNVGRHAAEAFSDSYQEQMKVLRESDNIIRHAVTDLKSNLKLAKKSLKQRRYLDVVHFIGNINDSIKLIGSKRAILRDMMKSHLDDFYGDYEHADLGREYFKKQAGIMDMFSGARRMAGKVFEKHYDTILKERARAMEELYNETDHLVDLTLDTLKDLGTYRAKGDINSYIKSLDELARKRDKFENKFKNIYDTYILPFIDRLKQQELEQSAAWRESVPARASEVAAPDIAPFLAQPGVEAPAQTAEVEEGVPFSVYPAAAAKKPVVKEEEAIKIEEPEVAPVVEVAKRMTQKQKVKPGVRHDPSGKLLQAPIEKIPVEANPVEKPALQPKVQPPSNPNIPTAFQWRAGLDLPQQPVPPPVKPPWAKDVVASDKLISNIIKMARQSGKSNQFISEMLIAYSSVLDENGDSEGSLKLMAIAEGLLDVE